MRVAALKSQNFISRIIEPDRSLWTEEREGQNEIKARIGWWRLPESSKKYIEELTFFREEIVKAGYRHVFLLGMGGSSLAPEVYSRIYGDTSGNQLKILDTTDPDQIKALKKGIPLKESLFIAASKSGGTVEVNALLDYFWALVKEECGSQTSQHFVAITDPGTSLKRAALSRNFRKIFLSDPECWRKVFCLNTIRVSTCCINRC